MSNVSKSSSAKYKVDPQKFADNWQRIYGKKTEESSIQIPPEGEDNKEKAEDS